MVKFTALYLFSFVLISAVVLEASNSERSFVINYENNSFYKDGEPFRYVSGSIHYFRVPHQFWRDRLQKMRAAGLNAISTYVEWSSHEPEEGVYDFNGDLDLVNFIKIAQEEDLYVILRPGPYICAERDLGGLPPWLLKNPRVRLRSLETHFKTRVLSWLSVLFKKLENLYYSKGGPIIMVQVENEYGSYDCEFEYTYWLRDVFKQHVGENVVLFTTDGSARNLVRCGKISGVYATIDFGTGGNVSKNFEIQRSIEPAGPLVNSEFYPGWLTHWGEKMARTETRDVVQALQEMLDMNANVNFYMFHGGTNFGFTAGANYFKYYAADITSYDYDAPLSEAGDMTEKYFAIQRVLLQYFPPSNKTVNNSVKGNYGEITLQRVATLFSTKIREKMGKKSVHERPKNFERLNHYYGYVLYETVLKNSTCERAELEIAKFGDVANVYINGEYVGTLSRENDDHKLNIYNVNDGDKLSIIVENLGRINYGPSLHDRKGILTSVLLNGKELKYWKMTAFDFKNLAPVIYCSNFCEQTEKNEECDNDKGFTFYYASYVLPEETDPFSNNVVLDTYLNMINMNKGLVFINGINLGRYWSTRKPQYTLYVPSVYLKPFPQKNQIVIMDEFLRQDTITVSFTNTPIFD